MTDDVEMFDAMLDRADPFELILWLIEDHLDFMEARALEDLDILVEQQKERFDFEWLVTMLERKIPPGPTGWFYYEYKVAEAFAKKVGLRHMLDRAIQRISPQGAGIALRAPQYRAQ